MFDKKKKIASEGVSIPLTFSGKIAPARKKTSPTSGNEHNNSRIYLAPRNNLYFVLSWTSVLFWKDCWSVFIRSARFYHTGADDEKTDLFLI
jgi:hypothetical protein